MSGSFAGPLVQNVSAGLPAALSTASGAAPSYSARAWVNFNGSGVVAIRASANVSSIVDNGVGDYTINFATAMPDTNYAYSLGFSASGGTIERYGQDLSTTSIRVSGARWNGSTWDIVDSVTATVAIFR